MKKTIFCILVLTMLYSCRTANCPTTDKRFFTKNVPKSKSLYNGYRSNKSYIVPYKYRKSVKSYGILKK